MVVLKQNLMQGWHYLKGLIYYRPIFRLTILAFFRARAILRENIFYLCFAFVLFFACGIDHGTSPEKLLHTLKNIGLNNIRRQICTCILRVPAPLRHPQSLPHASSDDVSAESFNLRELSEAFGR